LRTRTLARVQTTRARLQAAEDALKTLKAKYQAKCKEVEQLQSDNNLINQHAKSVESENRYVCVR